MNEGILATPPAIAFALRDSLQAEMENRAQPADRPSEPEISDSAAEGGWTTVLAPTADWLKAKPTLWVKATSILAKRFNGSAEDPSSEPSVSSRLFAELFRANSPNALTFLESIKHEANLREFGTALSGLELETEGAVGVLELCSRLRGNGQPPALADKLSLWAANNSAQAKQIVEDRIDASDHDDAMHVWALEPLVEGVVSARSATVEETTIWRDATLAALLDSPNPLRQSLAAYLSCVAWPLDVPIEQRHARLLSVLRRCPAALVPAGLAALTRDAWTHQDAVFQCLRAVAQLIEEASPPRTVAVALLRNLADVASRGIASLKGAPVPKVLNSFLPSLRGIPPVPRDGALDNVLGALWARDPELTANFLSEYVRHHAVDYLRSTTSLEEAFPVLVHAAGTGVLGTWLVRWMVDEDEGLRSCAAQWAGQNPAVLNPLAVKGLTIHQAMALVHVLLAVEIPGDALFKVVKTVARARDDLGAFVTSLFADELLVDYPGLTRAWVAQIEGEDSADPSLLALAADLRRRLGERDAFIQVRQQIPELRATSPAYLAWMELHQQANAAMQKEATKSSFFAQLMTTVHAARGEAMSHSIDKQAVPFVHQEFSYEQAARAVIDPLAQRISRVEHFEAARRLLKVKSAQ